MTAKNKTRNAVDGKIHVIRQGLAIYKVNASPFYRVRIRVPVSGKYLVKSTKTTSKISAIEAAEEYLSDLKQNKFIDAVPKELQFSSFADKLIDKQRQLAADGSIHPKQSANDESILLGKDGVVSFFNKMDIGSIRTADINAFLNHLRKKKHQKLASSTVNKKIIALRKVLKIAYEEGVIETIPDAPMIGRKDNPRPFFRFAPLVSEEKDEYEKLLAGAKELSSKGASVRGVKITEELYDFILFMVHSFLRPVESEIYALQFRHVSEAENPKRLLVTIADGKTGFRTINTLEACVSVYRRLQKRYPDHSESDYLFLPSYTNRRTAIRVMARQFNCLLEHIGLKKDPITKQIHTVYSLRHTAICMRIIKSEGKVNIYNLARTAGNSVDQIERFYTKYLPLSAEMARNLQTFGDKN